MRDANVNDILQFVCEELLKFILTFLYAGVSIQKSEYLVSHIQLSYKWKNRIEKKKRKTKIHDMLLVVYFRNFDIINEVLTSFLKKIWQLNVRYKESNV